MRPFMLSERLGDEIEATYQTIYNGGGTEFGVCVVRLVHMLGQLADAGMITNLTRKRIETFLTKDIRLSSMQVISRKTNDVVLINKEIHEQDSFELSEYITWITDELCKDPIMKKTLCGRENYEGVKIVLNSYADKNHKPVMKESWVDFYIHEGKVIFTKKDSQNIRLYVQEKKNDGLPFFGGSDECKETKLARENLLDGRIYHFSDGTVFVEAELGYIVRISDLGVGRCRYSRIEGLIINQLEDDSLLYINDSKLICLKTNGKRKVLVEDTFLRMIYTDGKEVFWKSRFRKKDLERGNFSHIAGLTNDKVRYCLNSENLSNEILWKGLLLTLYDFDFMEFVNKIGNRLRFARFFDKLPVPFVLNEILTRLSEIEEYCYDGDIIKCEGYTEAMSYLMTIEEEKLDEKRTFDALVYLLESVKINPYERVTSNAGTELLNCFDIIFGDIDEMNDASAVDEEERDGLLLDFSDKMTLDEIRRRLSVKLQILRMKLRKNARKKNL